MPSLRPKAERAEDSGVSDIATPSRRWSVVRIEALACETERPCSSCSSVNPWPFVCVIDSPCPTGRPRRAAKSSTGRPTSSVLCRIVLRAAQEGSTARSIPASTQRRNRRCDRGPPAGCPAPASFATGSPRARRLPGRCCPGSRPRCRARCRRGWMRDASCRAGRGLRARVPRRRRALRRRASGRWRRAGEDD